MRIRAREFEHHADFDLRPVHGRRRARPFQGPAEAHREPAAPVADFPAEAAARADRARFPYWIEDENFDLEYHVRHIALPKPATGASSASRRRASTRARLDLSKPLWELYLVEGLDSLPEPAPDSFAILAKVHHAAIDVPGRRITTLLHDTTARTAHREPPNLVPESPPGAASLLARAMINNVVRPLMFAGPLARAIGKAHAAVLGSCRRDLAQGPACRHAFQCGSVARIASSIRAVLHRRIQAHPRPGARRAINDAVLAVCGGALRRYLLATRNCRLRAVMSLAPFTVRASAPTSTTPEMSLVRVPLRTELPIRCCDCAPIHKHSSDTQDVDQACGRRN
jgi:hypothetical protein